MSSTIEWHSKKISCLFYWLAALARVQLVSNKSMFSRSLSSTLFAALFSRSRTDLVHSHSISINFKWINEKLSMPLVLLLTHFHCNRLYCRLCKCNSIIIYQQQHHELYSTTPYGEYTVRTRTHKHKRVFSQIIFIYIYIFSMLLPLYLLYGSRAHFSFCPFWIINFPKKNVLLYIIQSRNAGTDFIDWIAGRLRAHDENRSCICWACKQAGRLANKHG